MLDLSTARYANVFATPLLTYVWEDGAELNPLLRERILAREAASSGISKSNQGGWHSEAGRLEFCGEAGQRLTAYMHQLADEATKRVYAEQGQTPPPCGWTLSAWANVNRNGNFNKAHVHPGSTWSGTYYVDTGEPADGDRGAPLHLFDPCQGGSTSFLPSLPKSVYVHPRPGLTVLFPSYVPHMVFPHNGRSARISIAFNLRKEPYP